jgi:hypothetical protein
MRKYPLIDEAKSGPRREGDDWMGVFLCGQDAGVLARDLRWMGLCFRERDQASIAVAAEGWAEVFESSFEKARPREKANAE